VAEVWRNGTPMVLKLLYNKDIFHNEKTILENLKGYHHTIPLEGSFALEAHHCYGLLFKKYTEGLFKPKNEKELCLFMYKLLEALNYCHRLGYVHRDVKPSNIFFARQDDSRLEVVLGDFGLATRTQDCEDDTVGTVPYMAPEMLIIGDYGDEVDIWSAGVVFAEELFGTRPFKAQDTDSLQDVIDVFAADKTAYLQQKSPIFPALWKRLGGLILRMLEVNPNKRITAKEALEILQKELES